MIDKYHVFHWYKDVYEFLHVELIVNLHTHILKVTL